MENKNNPSGSLLSDAGLDDVLTLVTRKMMMEVDDMLPARNLSWDAAANRAKVEILYQVTMTSGEMHQMEAPAELPVQFPGGGGLMLVWPLKEGDLGWVKAVDRDMSLFLQSYDAQPGNTPRINCFEDGVFIPDVMHAFTVGNAAGMSIQTLDGANQVTVTASSTILKVGAATLTLTADKLVSSVPFEAPKIKGGGVEMVDHNHTNPEGVNVGPAKNP